LSIQIIKQGIACSIQDNGRYGFQHIGINPTGVMDTAASAVANSLVGNQLNDAVIEMHFPAPAFLFNKSTLAALSGADFTAMVNDIPIPVNTPFIIQKDCLLHFNKKIKGERCYLSIYKGLQIKQWLNSYSTNIIAKAGGLKGRYLEKGDEIFLNIETDFSTVLHGKDVFMLPWQAAVKSLYSANTIIKVIKGHEFDLLDNTSQQLFYQQAYSITPKSNNMGYCLKAAALVLKEKIQLLSAAVTNGTVQLLPSGQLIILMAAHQTIGGYPKAAHVASAAMPSLAQLSFNTGIQFKIIEQNEAEQANIQQQQYLHQLQTISTFRLNEFFSQHKLH
jgi:antagonist of KipI